AGATDYVPNALMIETISRLYTDGVAAGAFRKIDPSVQAHLGFAMVEGGIRAWMATPDNVQIIVPNGQAWGAIISNYSAHAARRVDLTFGIDYADDADKAMKIILDLAQADERVQDDPEPWARVVNLGDSSVDIGVRLWCDGADYWELKFYMTKAVKEAFDREGVSIPYPHTVEIRKSE
ncbi:MAG: hypothetical protein AAGL49_06010, partial [Pseudomonadota bacterium]